MGIVSNILLSRLSLHCCLSLLMGKACSKGGFGEPPYYFRFIFLFRNLGNKIITFGKFAEWFFYFVFFLCKVPPFIYVYTNYRRVGGRRLGCPGGGMETSSFLEDVTLGGGPHQSGPTVHTKTYIFHLFSMSIVGLDYYCGIFPRNGIEKR